VTKTGERSSPHEEVDMVRSTSLIRSTLLRIGAVAALVFGLLTITSGASALFGNPTNVASAGAVVPFVLWFNFGAGFAYVVASVGLWFFERWAAWLAVALAIATVIVFGLFGMHVASGGAYEMRTMWAMVVRASFWIVVAVLACATVNCLPWQTKRR
jgi:hypothetical protein